jgi:hypothetical protein
MSGDQLVDQGGVAGIGEIEPSGFGPAQDRSQRGERSAGQKESWKDLLEKGSTIFQTIGPDNSSTLEKPPRIVNCRSTGFRLVNPFRASNMKLET